MKIKLIFILTALAFSCGRFTESPLITEPQPDNGTELKKIPKSLLGTYKSLADSVDTTLLIVTEKEIIMKVVRNPNVSIAELDSTERKNLKDTVYQEGNDSMTVRVTSDSIFQRSIHFDTLYYTSDKYAIKKSKGYYFCNQQFRDKWVVRTVRTIDHGILISKLRSKEEINGLNDYSSLEPDSIAYDPPSDEKLRTYLTDEKFKDELIFVRIEYGLTTQAISHCRV
jgi:hypothetical protein